MNEGANSSNKYPVGVLISVGLIVVVLVVVLVVAYKAYLNNKPNPINTVVASNTPSSSYIPSPSSSSTTSNSAVATPSYVDSFFVNNTGEYLTTNDARYGVNFATPKNIKLTLSKENFNGDSTSTTSSYTVPNLNQDEYATYDSSNGPGEDWLTIDITNFQDLKQNPSIYNPQKNTIDLLLKTYNAKSNQFIGSNTPLSSFIYIYNNYKYIESANGTYRGVYAYQFYGQNDPYAADKTVPNLNQGIMLLTNGTNVITINFQNSDSLSSIQKNPNNGPTTTVTECYRGLTNQSEPYNLQIDPSTKLSCTIQNQTEFIMQNVIQKLAQSLN
jgi:hypothetical protein